MSKEAWEIVLWFPAAWMTIGLIGIGWGLQAVAKAIRDRSK